MRERSFARALYALALLNVSLSSDAFFWRGDKCTDDLSATARRNDERKTKKDKSHKIGFCRAGQNVATASAGGFTFTQIFKMDATSELNINYKWQFKLPVATFLRAHFLNKNITRAGRVRFTPPQTPEEVCYSPQCRTEPSRAKDVAAKPLLSSFFFRCSSFLCISARITSRKRRASKHFKQKLRTHTALEFTCSVAPSRCLCRLARSIRTKSTHSSELTMSRGTVRGSGVGGFGGAEQARVSRQPAERKKASCSPSAEVIAVVIYRVKSRGLLPGGSRGLWERGAKFSCFEKGRKQLKALGTELSTSERTAG